MRILVFSSQCIWPLTGGGRIRNFNLLRETARHHEVYYLSFLLDPNERENLKQLQSYCRQVVGIDLPRSRWKRATDMAHSCLSNRPFALYQYLRDDMAVALQRTIDQYKIDVVHAHGLHMGQYVLNNHQTPFVYDPHNLDHILWERFANAQTNPFIRQFARIQCPKYVHWLQIVASSCAKVVALSDHERNEYRRLAPGADVVVVPNGVDIEFYQPRPETPEPQSLIYYANFGWAPQDDAAIYFHDQILPLIQGTFPKVKLYFVGKTPPDNIRRLTAPNVIVTGYVEDIRDFIARAEVVVMPLRVGAGTKHRIFQALAMEKALVTTSVGAEGIALVHGQTAMIADSPEQFAACTLTLLENPQLRTALGQNGRQLVLDHYDWRAIYPTLDTAFHEAALKHHG